MILADIDSDTDFEISNHSLKYLLRLPKNKVSIVG